jgi:gamma-glutamyltranspeptidase/glutathione hydrolase
MGGLGGLGSMNIFWMDSNENIMIDFYEKTPAAADVNMFEPIGDVRGGFFKVKNSENEMGYKACCTPGFISGLFEAYKLYGSLPWKVLLKPAIKHARQGFPVHEDLYLNMIKTPREGHIDKKKNSMQQMNALRFT